jgi:hypothetical protein
MFQTVTVSLNALCNCCAKIAFCSSEVDLHDSLCWQQYPKCEGAILLVYTHLFCKLHSLLNPTKKSNPSEKRQRLTVHARFKHLYLDNHSELEICLYELFFSQWLILSPSKILTFPPATSCIFLRRPIYLVYGNWLSSKLLQISTRMHGVTSVNIDIYERQVFLVLKAFWSQLVHFWKEFIKHILYFGEIFWLCRATYT